MAGWSVGPSPNGAIQACSPVFRSMAVIRWYGGLRSGSPWGLPTRPPRLTHRHSLRSGSGGATATRVGCVRDWT